jgi:hypothetical protein
VAPKPFFLVDKPASATWPCPVPHNLQNVLSTYRRLPRVSIKGGRQTSDIKIQVVFLEHGSPPFLSHKVKWLITQLSKTPHVVLPQKRQKPSQLRQPSRLIHNPSPERVNQFVQSTTSRPLAWDMSARRMNRERLLRRGWWLVDPNQTPTVLGCFNNVCYIQNWTHAATYVLCLAHSEE